MSHLVCKAWGSLHLKHGHGKKVRRPQRRTRERASGSVVALAFARLPARVRSLVILTLVSHRVLRPVCGCACVCLSMSRFETTRTDSSALRPVSMGAQNFT